MGYKDSDLVFVKADTHISLYTVGNQFIGNAKVDADLPAMVILVHEREPTRTVYRLYIPSLALCCIVCEDALVPNKPT